MSALDLTSYDAIESNLLVKIEVANYKANAAATPIAKDLLFSDRLEEYADGADSYVALGNFLNITSSASELRVSGYDLTISIAGIPDTSIYEIVNSDIKGSKITVQRALFDGSDGSLISVTPNPVTRFLGYVNNLALDEDYDVVNRTSTNTLVLSCTSVVDVMNNKIAGRKTNSSSQKRFYSTDISMDRVSRLEDTKFNFGG